MASNKINSWNELRWFQDHHHVEMYDKIPHPVCPPMKDWYSALETVSPPEVRAVILGQDPYPTPGMATGLAFSVPSDTRELPPSLVNVFSEYVSDLHFPWPSSGDLSGWARSGVLLWNSVLTCAPRSPRSHVGLGWERLTAEILDVLCCREPSPVFILWGMDARTVFGERTGKTIVSSHPSPLSARRGFFGSRPFSRCNAELVRSGQQPVNWRLP